MFDNYQICPYTGLRSFTEEESLYFKGREEDIDQATTQLQRNKFLMLTGASGDGKSSLVYAGIVPNARAGFLKSKYTQWCIANFRPERTPFRNLCKSVARELQIPNDYTVQGELNHGFSALVDLYKNSKRFIDTHSSAWQQAGEKERSFLKREAANLIILVDQFEEFFTNPENYQAGAPSRDSNLVLNLLLETARIALEEDLPVYVIFTMRSDYIGQCAAFRGLPEYIGFSQFFVPRLNRSQLQQVIEEPATLSGNRIARRLTERLIHDITEGVDQLPILQHALNQIWVAASHGTEEMDLLHYAMVGGMSVNELPDEQSPLFGKWFQSLTPEIKACYHAPNLQNVLDTHTNKLYEEAAGYYTARTGKPISTSDARQIIRTAFTCLTKIDQGRAVRNRMTLQEITHIAGNPDYDAAAAGSLLNIFREPGNTFIHPFISEDETGRRDLQPNQVLDITHESLIRNWQYLGQWAREEFESYSVSLDFEKQLGRWMDSHQSSNFLLSIGPLTYFESWFRKVKPNAYWIARYLPEGTNNETRLVTATAILDNSKEFIRRSARSHIITRTIMRYGPRRIAITLGILAFLTLTSFAIRDYFKKQNGAVFDSIRGQTLQLAADPKVTLLSKASLVVEELKLGRLTVDALVPGIPDTIQRIITINAVASLLILQGGEKPKLEIDRCLSLADSLLETLTFPENNLTQLSIALREINNHRFNLELEYYNQPDPQVEGWRQKNGKRSATWSRQLLLKQPAGFTDFQNLELALENAINYQAFSNGELRELLGILSPFENGLETSWLRTNFDKDKLLIRGSLGTNYGFKFNGLYQELAYLYAASGNTRKVLQCLDSLLANSQNNFQGDYEGSADNATNIAAVYFLNNQQDSLDAFVKGYCTRKKITEENFYDHLTGRMLKSNSTTSNLRIYFFMDENMNLNLQFCSRKLLNFAFTKYRAIIQSAVKDREQNNFLTALTYKNEGILKSLNKEIPGPEDTSPAQLFEKAVSYYQAVSPSWREQRISMIDATGGDQVIAPRKFLFIYPDFRTAFHPAEPRSFFYFYFGDGFMDYIVSHQLTATLYPTPEDLNYLSVWINSFHSKNISPSIFLIKAPRQEIFKKLLQQLENRPDTTSVDFNLLYLYLGYNAQQAGNLDEMLGYYDKIKTASLLNLLRTKDFGGNVNNQTFRLIGYAIDGFTKAGRPGKSRELITLFKSPVNRSSLYAFAASELLREKIKNPLVQSLIDSARLEMSRVENTSAEQPNRRLLAYALTMQDPSKNSNEAFTLLKNLPAKFSTIQQICKSFAFYGELYKAMSRIPEAISGSDQADFLKMILLGYSQGNGIIDAEWDPYKSRYQRPIDHYILFIDENS